MLSRLQRPDYFAMVPFIDHYVQKISCVSNKDRSLPFQKFLYMHACIHTYIHTYIHTSNIHTYIHTYKQDLMPCREVTNKGFDGCIKDLTLATTLRDINDNKVAKGVLPGCPEVSQRFSVSGKRLGSLPYKQQLYQTVPNIIWVYKSLRNVLKSYDGLQEFSD